MIEGLIGKDDHKKKTEFYDSEIAKITAEISGSIDINTRTTSK